MLHTVCCVLPSGHVYCVRPSSIPVFTFALGASSSLPIHFLLQFVALFLGWELFHWKAITSIFYKLNWKIIWHNYIWHQRIIKVWARDYFILLPVFQYHNFMFPLFSKCKCKVHPKRLPRTKSIDCKLSANGLVVITWSVLGNFVSGNFPSPTKCQMSSTNSKNISRKILSVRNHPLTGQMLNGLLRPIWWKHFQMNTLYQEASPHWPNAE